MTVKLRKVKQTERNLATIRYLDRVCFQGDSPFPVYEDTILWVGYDDGIPVCFAALAWAYESTGFLSRAGVLPQYSGQGLHRRMINLRIRAAKKLGWKSLITYTHRHNAKSLNNLTHCGFKGYQPQQDWGGDDAVYVWKEL